MAVQQSQKKQDISEIKKRLLNMVDVMTKLDVYDKKQMAEAHELCENYDFTKESEGRINIMREDCIAHIMEYAGYGSDMIRDFHSIVQQYRELPDMMSTDNEARQLRREITKVFYDIYTKAFMRSVEELVKPSPIMMMFFNFGFMDAEVLGETNTNALYNLTDSLGLFHSANVYTVYDWLVQIYQGKKEPSRNEFDQDFNAFLLEEKRTGNITEAQMQQYKNDSRQKVQFEIRNMFTSGNRVTYGRVTTFCPVLMEEDFINTVEKMAVTAEKIADAINKVRCVDYSALYHDVMFSDPDRGINQEWIKKEILPDVILMPNAGTRTLMCTVRVGGVDVRDYNLDVLRREVSMVLQKNVLFSGTILDNLRWGDANATEEECIRMAKLACADEFIQRFPDKYNTWIEQGGSNVSGGQKQRLTIARALLRKPKVLILDDSTSAVDTATDAKIRKAFREEIPGTTKIIIAQRISSVQDADRILVLENGQINGLGTHAELLANLAKIEASDVLERLGLEPHKYMLLSAHREENIDTEKNFIDLFTSINHLAQTYDMPILYSCHPRSKKRLDAMGFQLDERVKLHEPLGFHDYNHLQMNAFAVVSDSGTLPEESSFFTSVGHPFPAVCIRTSTERPEALDKGCFVLAGISEGGVEQAVATAVAMNANGDNGIPVPYYTEDVSTKVVKIIQSYTGVVNKMVWRKN